MTVEEKLTAIRHTAEEEYLYLFNASHGFHGSEIAMKCQFAKDWLEWIDKIISEDGDAVSVPSGFANNEILAAAKQHASRIDYSYGTIRTRDNIYIRGFIDGCYWKKKGE